MSARDLLATAPSQGGDAPAWTWYVPLVLMAVLIAALSAYAYFIKTLMPLVLVLLGLAVGAVMVGVLVGEPQSMKIAQSWGDRGPKNVGQFIGMLFLGAFITLIAEARRRGHDGVAVDASPDEGDRGYWCDWGDWGDGATGATEATESGRRHAGRP